MGNNEELMEIFCKASRFKVKKPLTQKELEDKVLFDGFKKFRAEAFGFFGFGHFFKNYVTKSLEEMGQLLYKTGSASSIEEGKKLVPSLVDQEFRYFENHEHGYVRMSFDEVITPQGEVEYRIT